MFSAADTAWMHRALALAHQGRYWTSPNPHVGCVLVRDGHVIGEGFTQPAGGNHAEIQALQQAGDARGATAYVTLEPCAHRGRTGPCADALIEAGINRVVAALEDPNPLVAGQGLARLAAAGVTAESGLLADEAAQEIAGFLARMTRGWGRVRVKMAGSLDGRSAMRSGESQWITGAAARADVQCLRAQSCVVLTGIDTVLADDCALTVRAQQLPLTGAEQERALYRKPLRVVLDSRGRLTPNCVLCRDDAPTLVITGQPGMGLPPSVEVLTLPLVQQRLPLEDVLRVLGERGANEILVEAGATLAGALITAGLVDEIVYYQAAKLLGASARPLVEMHYDALAEVPEFTFKHCQLIGDDVRLTLVPKAKEAHETYVYRHY